jgi:hypothetical protein
MASYPAEGMVIYVNYSSRSLQQLPPLWLSSSANKATEAKTERCYTVSKLT